MYCLEKNLQATKGVITTLTKNSVNKNVNFKIHPIHKLFFHLKNKCAEFVVECPGISLGFPLLSNAAVEIEKDIFCYVTNLSCDVSNHTANNTFND